MAVFVASFVVLVLLIPAQAERVRASYTSAEPISSSVSAKTIEFSNYTWQVRSGSGGPGPNLWADNNVWVDAGGRLHLAITHVGDSWYCAELTTTSRFGFGVYQFQVIGRLDQLDQNVVLGLFNYPPPDVGPDTTNEIDIEIARWGQAAYPNGNYTVWPAETGADPASYTFPFTLTGDYTTHRFAWTSQEVAFQSLHGHTDGNENEFAQWSYRPSQPAQAIPQQPLPVHLNLWLFRGQPPTDGQAVEIIISHFSFQTQTYLPMIFG
jgi:hypothetical protein